MLPAGLESPVTPPHDPSAYAVLSTQPVDTDNNQLPPPPLPEEPEPGELPAGAPQPHAAAAAVNVQNSDDLPSLDDGPADAGKPGTCLPFLIRKIFRKISAHQLSSAVALRHASHGVSLYQACGCVLCNGKSITGLHLGTMLQSQQRARAPCMST